MKRAGFTIVEILVAVLILGFVLTGLLALMTGTLNFSTVSVSTSDRLRELNDVTGYVADRVRGAIDLVPNATLPNPQLNGELCDDEASLPCFGAVIGFDNDSDKPGFDAFQYLGFKVIPRTELGEDYKESDAWADSNTYVVQEYRRWICSDIDDEPCNGNPPEPEDYAEIFGAQPALVLDGLTLEDINGDPYRLFELEGDTITLRFRVADHRRGTTRYTPAEGTYELTVIKRN